MNINNKELILPLLEFTEEGDFYSVLVLKRKKDQPENEKDNHQSVRTIKTYVVESVEYLEKRWDEITHLCEYFKARAYISVQKQNHKQVGLQMLSELALRIANGNYKFNNLFDSTVGKLKPLQKRWIVDIDTKNDSYINKIVNTINSVKPVVYNLNFDLTKIKKIIPTKQGVHLITHPFDVQEFTKELVINNIVVPDIQKCNPTLLYLPNSLM